jgi:hypothetical protein
MKTLFLMTALVFGLALSLSGLEALLQAIGGNRMILDYLKSFLMAIGFTICLPWLIVNRGEKGMSKA